MTTLAAHLAARSLAQQRLLSSGTAATPPDGAAATVPSNAAEVVADLSIFAHQTYAVENFGDYNDERRHMADLDKAHVISSEIVDVEGVPTGRHTVMLDIDVPARLIPSSTPGHSHLYIDAEFDGADLDDLLETLARVGVIETGYARMSAQRGHCDLRLPWVRKEIA